jgi:hypothetical protein
VGRHRRLVAMLTAYGDDSSDNEKKSVFAAATVVGRESEWSDFEIAWKRSNGDRPFHSTDCDADGGEFKATDHKENKALYRSNVELLARSPFMGYAIAISIRDYRQIFGGSRDEWPYYACFAGAVAGAASVGKRSIPPEPVEIIFDRNFQREYNTGRLYDFMVREEHWKINEYLSSKIGFDDHRKNIGLQAADLLAREAMKHLDNQLLREPRPTRLSFTALASAQRFCFEFIDRRRMLQLREQMDAIPALGRANDAYTKWLNGKGLKDTPSARLQFMNAANSLNHGSDVASELKDDWERRFGSSD